MVKNVPRKSSGFGEVQIKLSIITTEIACRCIGNLHGKFVLGIPLSFTSEINHPNRISSAIQFNEFITIFAMCDEFF